MSNSHDTMAMDTSPSQGLSASADRRGDGPGSAPRSPSRTGGSRTGGSRTGGGRPREGDWLNGQLRRLYDDVLSEPIPDDLLDLVGRLDEAGKDGGDADGSGRPAEDPAETRETSRS